MQELDDLTKEGYVKENKKYIYQYILIKAKKHFIDAGFTKFDPEKALGDEEKLQGKFYMLPSEWIDFTDN
jgi:hypothetical protein